MATGSIDLEDNFLLVAMVWKIMMMVTCKYSAFSLWLQNMNPRHGGVKDLSIRVEKRIGQSSSYISLIFNGFCGLLTTDKHGRTVQH
jgi:hypothetical protein